MKLSNDWIQELYYKEFGHKDVKEITHDKHRSATTTSQENSEGNRRLPEQMSTPKPTNKIST